MKWLFILLFLVSCQKKDTVRHNEPLEVDKCYQNELYSFKVLQTYEHDTYRVRALNSNEQIETIWSQPDKYEIKKLDCDAFNDLLKWKEEADKNQSDEFKNQCFECLKNKVECDDKKEESSESD